MKPILRFGILGILILFVFVSCEKIIYTTDNTDPTITIQPSIIEATDNSVQLYWKTDEACHAEVYYGISEGKDSVYTDIENRQIHAVILEELLPKMTYNCRVKVWDFVDNGPVESDEFIFTTLPNEFSYLREAWEKYAEQNYTNAAVLIGESLKINDYNPEIIATSGWIFLKNNQTDSARVAIESAYQLSPYMPLALTGRALLAQLDGLPADVITNCQIVISREPEWEYQYNSSINIHLVRLLLAEAFVQTDQSINAQNQLDIAWPDNGLDPNIPASWIVNSESFTDYTLALLAAIYNAIDQL